MLRLSRRFTTALLWLAIALLPVRVGAAVWMPVVMGGMASSAVAQAAGMDGMPCHGAAAPSPHAMPEQAAPDDDATTAHACSLCALCHVTVAQAPAAVSLPSSLPEALPHADADTRVASRQPEALFRPPRSALA